MAWNSVVLPLHLNTLVFKKDSKLFTNPCEVEWLRCLLPDEVYAQLLKEVAQMTKAESSPWTAVTDHFTKMLLTMWLYNNNQCGLIVWHPYISVLIWYSRPHKLPQHSPKPIQSSNSKCLVTVTVPLTHTCIQANNSNCTNNAKSINAVRKNMGTLQSDLFKVVLRCF